MKLKYKIREIYETPHRYTYELKNKIVILKNVIKNDPVLQY